MPTPKKDLEISVESIVLDKTVFRGKSKRLADFRLVYPRLTLAQKTSSKTLVLDGAEIKALGGFLELPAAGLAKAVTGKAATVRTAAQGVIDIDASAYAALKSGETATIPIPVLAAHDVVEERRRPTKTEDRVTRKTIAKADAPVGTVTLRLKAL